jgi:phage terminase large subunit-like protein
MLKRALEAKNVPAKAAEFKQKRLNLWVNTHQPCLSMEGWKAGQTTWQPEDMAHESCYLGIDLGAKLDLCALSVVFPPTPGRSSWRVLQYLWTPADTLIDRAHADKAPYPIWVEQGWLRTCPGTSVNYALVREAIQEIRALFDVERIGLDAWHADQLQAQLIEDGWHEDQVLEVPQTYAGMSSGELSFKGEVLAGNIDARGCPVTAWAASNVVEQTDGKGNIFFVKKRSRGRIDPIKAITIAVSLAKRFGAAQSESVYESRGALVF